MYSLTSNASIYVQGNNLNRVLLNNSDTSIANPQLSPPRLNEDLRYCTSGTCLAFSHFPPGSITDEAVTYEPNIPLYKFIGGWGDLSAGHLGMSSPPLQPTPGTLYEGPDLIVKKVSISSIFSIFILHNNTVLVSGSTAIPPPTNGPVNLYRPIVYRDISDPSSVKIVDASASPKHGLLLSDDHRLFFFGANDGYTYGNPDMHTDTLVKQVREVPLAGVLYPDDYVIQIRAQYCRSSVITKMGYVYIWGTWTNSNSQLQRQKSPTLESTFLQNRYAVGYLNQDDITKTTQNAVGSCILTRPRPGSCAGEPPSADYYCIGGLWTTRGGSNLETLNITSPTAIDGNLTISGTLVINPQSNISVTQCLSIGSIEIVKPEIDDSPSQDIISTDNYCPDISGTTINVIPQNMTKCEKMAATLSKSETGGRTIYTAIFNVDDDDCNIKNCTGEPPSADYHCIGGLWTTTGDSTIATLNISSPTEIAGNLTISGTLVINPQSSISVTGCLSIGSIEIVKQQGDDSPSPDIISTDKQCPDISGTPVSVIPTGTKCEKMTATLWKNETGGRMVYSAIFNVNDTDCKFQNCTGDPPSADFDCIGGVWAIRGGGSIETLTISSPIEIDGNLTISGTLIINPQSSISVTQCLSTGSIEIVKQQGDDSPSQSIISTGKNCPDISATPVSVISTGNVKKCEKKTASLSKSETEGRITYSAIFKVNNNDCKRWWIILVSVLGGVVVILIIAILIALPFWRRQHELRYGSK